MDNSIFVSRIPLTSSLDSDMKTGTFIGYIDALFVCYSALTVTGLSTINLSTCTAFQQAILFFLMCIGNVVSDYVEWPSNTTLTFTALL